MSFCQLPDDLIEYIFLQLSPYGELQRAGEVCRRWNRLRKGAERRLQQLLRKCECLEWFLLVESERGGGKFPSSVAERCSHAAAYLPQDEAVYVFGGCTASYTTFNDLWRLDLRTRAWVRPVPSGNFPSPKACASVVEHAGKLYLFGGWSKSSPNPIHQTAMFFNELHTYCTKSNTWSVVGTAATAPHLAGHSATVVGNNMVVFGGSHGSGSTNEVWLFNFSKREWSCPRTSGPKPLPRYGQSQVNIDDSHLLVIGGCGGPNLIFNDLWLLSMGAGEWVWEEVTCTNPSYCAPQIWSHPACKIRDSVVVLSRPIRGLPGRRSSAHRQMSSSARRGSQGWSPPQTNLLPPRRKLLTSRSLDEEKAPPSPSFPPKGAAELQRAQSIPAIIVGEIPKLVVTEESSSAEPREDGCIAMVGSSLLPNQASVLLQNPPPSKRERVGSAGKWGRNREKQLQMLRRMEDYIRSKSRGHSSESSLDSPSGSAPRLPPSSPPPRSKQVEFHSSKNPMCVYVLEIGAVLAERKGTWRLLEENMEAPEDTILYSLVKARGELIMFGGMKSGSSEQQGLDVTPFQRAITNETYFLRPPVTL